MLDAIRRNAQSWGVKVIFGIIILVFVFWGVGSFRSERGNILAEINGSPLLLEEFQKVYSQTLDNLRRENPGINIEELERMNLRGQIFAQMVGTHLLEQEAQRLNIHVSGNELRQRITQLQAFHDQDQRFDPERYRAVLRAHNLTPAQFESDFRLDMIMEKLQEFIVLPTYVSEQEVRDYFRYAQEQVVVEYLSFPWNHELEQFAISDEIIESHYQANLDAYKIPARIKIKHLTISPAVLARPENVKQEDIADYYAANAQEYSKPEQVRASHILIKIDPDAPETEANAARESLIALLLRLHEGESFADLAREHSEDVSATQGGDLGWFGRGEMVPDFEEAAFTLQPGKTSDPVRTAFGWHLIHVQDRRENATIPLDEVAPAIRAHLAEEQALETLSETLDNALEQVIMGASLEEIGQSLQLPVRQTEYFSLGHPPDGLDLAPESIAQLFAMDDQEITHTPILLPEGYLLAQKVGHEPEAVRPLEEVRERILTRLRLDKAKAVANEKAQQTLELIAANDPQAFARESLTTSAPFGRQGFIPEVGFNPELGSAAFNAQPGEWLPSSYQTQDAFIVARLKERIAPPEEQWLQERETWRRSLLQNRQRELLQAFMETLQAGAEIKILRQDVLQPNQ
ncbi:MAG TPA: peptidylprolyl isomerase [Desulfonatronum sp.]|nr:peptidylprolyl isomerase [Desulfonatronum sp.]